MTLRYLLDANIVSYYLRRSQPQLEARVSVRWARKPLPFLR